MKKVILLLAVMFSMNAAAQVRTTSLMLGDTIVGEVDVWPTMNMRQRKDVTLFYKLPSDFVLALEAKYDTKVEYAIENEEVIPDTAGDLLVAAGQWKNASFGFSAAGAVGALALVQGDPDTAGAVSIASGLLAILCDLRGNFLIMKAGRLLNEESKLSM